MSDITRAVPAPQEIDSPLTASIAKSGIEIGARRYVSAQRIASMLGVSLRTSFPLDRGGRRATENQDRQKGLLRPRQACGMASKSRNPNRPYTGQH